MQAEMHRLLLLIMERKYGVISVTMILIQKQPYTLLQSSHSREILSLN